VFPAYVNKSSNERIIHFGNFNNTIPLPVPLKTPSSFTSEGSFIFLLPHELQKLTEAPEERVHIMLILTIANSL
jgi:hypothetical protein